MNEVDIIHPNNEVKTIQKIAKIRVLDNLVMSRRKSPSEFENKKTPTNKNRSILLIIIDIILLNYLISTLISGVVDSTENQRVLVQH